MPSTTPDSRIRRVSSFSELLTTPFANGINALCWERTLPGDFAEVVALLSRRASVLQTPRLGSLDSQPPSEISDEPNEGITTIQPSTLESLLAADSTRSAISDQVSALQPAKGGQAFTRPPAGSTRAALQVLLEDLQLLRAQNRDPVLNLIHAYPHDEDGGPVPTDVYSFHADSAPIPADTWLCTYHGAPSEGLRNEDAVRKVDVPAIRAELLKLHGGPDDESFADFLSENHYDLHYAPRRSAISGQPSGSSAHPSTFSLQPSTATPGLYSFGVAHLWRICCDYPNAPVPPCIHRAPLTQPGDPPRLLLIS